MCCLVSTCSHLGSNPSLHKLRNPSFNWHNKSAVVLYCRWHGLADSKHIIFVQLVHAWHGSWTLSGKEARTKAVEICLVDRGWSGKKRRNDWSLRQGGLFLSQFIPFSVNACPFRLNELFELYDLWLAEIIVMMFVLDLVYTCSLQRLAFFFCILIKLSELFWVFLFSS